MGHTAYYGIGDSKFRKNLRNDLSQRRPAIIVWRWVRDLRAQPCGLVEQQGVAYAKTVAETMNLNSTRTIQQTGRNCAEQFSILWPGEKCQSKKGAVEIFVLFQTSIKPRKAWTQWGASNGALTVSAGQARFVASCRRACVLESMLICCRRKRTLFATSSV